MGEIHGIGYRRLQLKTQRESTLFYFPGTWRERKTNVKIGSVEVPIVLNQNLKRKLWTNGDKSSCGIFKLE